MRHQIILFATAAALIASPALAATRSFTVGNFTKIRATGPHDVTVNTGKRASVVATGDGEALAQLEVTVVDGELRISERRHGGWTGSDGDANLVVTVPTLEGAILTGSGTITVDRVASPSFAGSLTGSGDFNVVRLEADSVDLALAGSGDMTLGGKCGSANVVLRGSGDIDASRLQCRDVRVALTGSGDVAIGASGAATLGLTGSGDISITGGARCTSVQRGSGEVSCR